MHCAAGYSRHSCRPPTPTAQAIERSVGALSIPVNASGSDRSPSSSLCNLPSIPQPPTTNHQSPNDVARRPRPPPRHRCLRPPRPGRRPPLLDTLRIDPQRIVASSRNPDKLQAFAARGVVTRRLDFADAASVTEAAQGVDRVLLISSDDFFGRVAGHKTAIAALADAGVKHIAYTSLQGLDNNITLAADDHRQTEAFIRDNAKFRGYTLLRNGLYFENHVGSIASGVKSGQWYTAAKDGKVSLLSRDDLGRAAAYALVNAKDDDRTTYELTGREALSVDVIVAEVNAALATAAKSASKATPKTIEIVRVSPEELAKGISAATGWPEAVTTILASFDANVAAGRAGGITGDFEKLTGAIPASHAEWLATPAVQGLLTSFL